MVEVSRERICQQLQEIDPYQFEKVVAEIWELQGYRTTVRQESGDRGIDIEAVQETPFDQRVLIQAKRYAQSNKVGSDEVRTYATLYQQVPDADTVVIVTTSRFTREAKKLAQDLNVKAVDGSDFADLVREYHTEIDSFDLTSDRKNTAETSYSGGDSSETDDSDGKTDGVSGNKSSLDIGEGETHPFDITPSMVEPTQDHEHRQGCSVCGANNSIWYTEGSNSGELLKCDSCGTLWGKKGLIFKSWKILKEGDG